MQIYLLAVFMLAGSALLNLSLSFLVFLIVIFFCVSASIIFLTFVSEDSELRLSISDIKKVFVKTLPMPLLAIPLAAVIFVVLPRTNYPMFGFLNASQGGMIGFSDKVSLGDVSNINTDNSVIFRAKMKKISNKNLYWRGVVLDTFDGETWKSSNIEDYEKGVAGEIVEQTIYLEPYYDRYLFGLDMPVDMDGKNLEYANKNTFRATRALTKKTAYSVTSLVSEYRQAQIDHEHYITLPGNISEKVLNFARQFDSGRGIEDANLIERYFKTSGFKYSVKDLAVGDDALEKFLFEIRSGNCEYYASSMAIFLRKLGIPARLVGGYRGGYFNKNAGYYTVLQKNAHVWVEAYFEGSGWKTFDPTPVSQGYFTNSSSKSLLMRIRLYIDTLSYYWNAFVINYDIGKQMSAFRAVGDTLKSPLDALKNNFKLMLVVLVAGVVVFFSITYRSLFKLSFKTKEQRVVETYYKVLKQKRIDVDEKLGLTETLTNIDDESLKIACENFVSIFQSGFYSKKEMDFSSLKEALNEIRSIKN
jgi:transglutaminase-like putative cysteine protease